MFFKKWLYLNENIESNFDLYLSNLVKYAKPEEKRQLESHRKIQAYIQSVSTNSQNSWVWLQKDIIIKVLKEKHLENFNWFSFSIGYLVAKINIYKEDLELAIDVTKKRIDSRDLPKFEIGVKGWFKIGQEAKEKVDEYIKASQELSNRQERKLRKSGETLESDKKLIELVATEGDLKLYHLPAIGSGTEHGLPKDENEIKSRKRVLCKYGKGTGWCTAVPDGDWHENYLGNNIYIIHEKDKPVYQFVSCLDEGEENHQFMDTEDRSVKELDMRFYDFLKKYATPVSQCYEIKPRFNTSMFLSTNVDNSLKREISGKNLAQILNSALNSDFEKMTSILNNLDVSFDQHDIFDFLWHASSTIINNLVVKNLINKNINKLSGIEVHDLVANSAPVAHGEWHARKTQLNTEEMIEILGNNLEKINTSMVIGIIQNSTNRKEMVRLLGKDVLQKLKSSPSDIISWIVHSSDVKETLDIIGQDNLKTLVPSEIDAIFTSKYLLARHSKEDMQYLVEKLTTNGKLLNMSSVANILLNIVPGEENYILDMIKILGKENVSKLWHETILKLFDEIFAKKGFEGQNQLAKLLKNYYLKPEFEEIKTPSDYQRRETRMSDYAKIENLINKHLH